MNVRYINKIWERDTGMNELRMRHGNERSGSEARKSKEGRTHSLRLPCRQSSLTPVISDDPRRPPTCTKATMQAEQSNTCNK